MALACPSVDLCAEPILMFIPFHTKIYLAIGETDMRKSINDLPILVEDRFEMDPFSAQLFVFSNRRRNMVKIL